MHIVLKRDGSEDVSSAGTVEEGEHKKGEAVTNIAPTSLRRLVDRQAVIKKRHKPECCWALYKDSACIRALRFVHVFCMTAPSPNHSLELGSKVSATKYLSTDPNRITV